MAENKEKPTRTLQDLNLCDRYLFARVMSDETICKAVLEKILGFEISEITYLEPEVTKEAVYGARSIRLDIHATETGRIYTVEMQTSDEYNLPKRSRYYHSIIDADKLLKAGEKYNNLADSYVIFICTFDPFGEKLHRYTYRNECEEKPGLLLEDGNQTIFLNSKWQDDCVDEDMAGFLKYIDNSTTAVADETGSEFVGMIDRKVKSIKENLDEGVKFMQFEEIVAEERKEERLAIARKMLQDNVGEDIVAKYTGLTIEEVNELGRAE